MSLSHTAVETDHHLGKAREATREGITESQPISYSHHVTVYRVIDRRHGVRTRGEILELG